MHTSDFRREPQVITLSPELAVGLGEQCLVNWRLAHGEVVLLFEVGERGRSATMRVYGAGDAPPSDRGSDVIALRLTLAALSRLGGRPPTNADRQGYHLITELRAIVIALRDCALTGEARVAYRSAKAVELACETVAFIAAGRLTPLSWRGELSPADAGRVLMAKRIIDERCGEKLSLRLISRACGLNRAKLTRGFREIFGSSVAQALAEQRLNRARGMLLTTDLPVAAVGYQSGYFNNASFARAFARRFGVPPSRYRTGASPEGLAA